MTPKAQATQVKTRQMILHETRKLLHSKGKRVERQPTRWEKIFANPIFYEMLISKIYTELHNNKQTP